MWLSPLWTLLELNWTHCSHSTVKVDSTWHHLTPLEPIGTHLTSLDSIWTNLTSLEGESVDNSTAVPGTYAFQDYFQRSTFLISFHWNQKVYTYTSWKISGWAQMSNIINYIASFFLRDVLGTCFFSNEFGTLYLINQVTFFVDVDDSLLTKTKTEILYVIYEQQNTI